MVNLERRGWPVTPWWRGQGGTPNLIKTFWITALRTLGSTEMRIKSFWITAWRALGSKNASKKCTAQKIPQSMEDFLKTEFRISQLHWGPARRTTTHKVKDISDVNGPSKFQRISIYEGQNLVNLERRGWPVTPWWRGQGGTPQFD